MKFASIFCLVFFAAAAHLGAQSPAIKDFEKNISEKQGTAFVTDALELSRMYYAENLLDKTVEWADKSIEAARKLGDKGSMALALSLRGKAQMKIQSRRNTYKNKAYKSFEESNSLTGDHDLKMENLELMKILAGILNKRKDLDAVEREMALLKGEVLTKEVTNLSEQQRELQKKQETLQQSQQNLITMVASKEAAIQNMTSEQVRKELLLSEKERLLDSLTFSSILDSLDLAQTEIIVKQQESELLQKQAELDLRKSQRNFLIAIASLGLLLLIGLFHRYFVMRRHNHELAEKNVIIEAERKRSEELLLNILPVTVAEELKKSGTSEARHYTEATVLFTDFKGFSQISKILSPEELVNSLDYAFKNFDRIIGKHGLEKIKTIGDAYMCAGGLPGKVTGHPVHVVQAALEIQQFLRSWNTERSVQGLPAFEARIGIHTGPLVAGVVGSKKFAYDIWGDTVNVASRMESSSEAGRVNISSSTFNLVKDRFTCEFRGKVPAKNVGEVEMYFVEQEVGGLH